jgi:hypothetical protein
MRRIAVVAGAALLVVCMVGAGLAVASKRSGMVRHDVLSFAVHLVNEDAAIAVDDRRYTDAIADGESLADFLQGTGFATSHAAVLLDLADAYGRSGRLAAATTTSEEARTILERKGLERLYRDVRLDSQT